MIFLTVGTQLPFDRLTSCMDVWCARTGRSAEVFGQIGRLDPRSYRPRHFPFVEMVNPPTFNTHFREASLIVSHAGMGSIITAMSFGKPIIILPRRAHLGEQRNDHQYATVRRLGSRRGIFAALTEEELPDLIDQARTKVGRADSEPLSPFADQGLIRAIHDFIRAAHRK